MDDTEQNTETPADFPPASSSLAALTPQAAHAFQTLNKCVFALRLRGDPIAEDIWTSMCELSHCFHPSEKPTERSIIEPK